MTTDDMIDVLTAFRDGKDLQFRRGDESRPWEDTENPRFNFNICEYRVKPEPRTIFLRFNSNGSVLEANHLKHRPDGEWVEFREVVNNDCDC